MLISVPVLKNAKQVEAKLISQKRRQWVIDLVKIAINALQSVLVAIVFIPIFLSVYLLEKNPK